MFKVFIENCIELTLQYSLLEKGLNKETLIFSSHLKLSRFLPSDEYIHYSYYLED